MKRLILYLSFFIFSITAVRAQIILGALSAGINLTQVDGDEVYGFHKVGFNGGPSAIIPFAKRWSVSIETLFSQKGSYQKPQYDDSLSYEYKLNLNYVEVPLLVHFEDKRIVCVGAGVSWSRLVGVKEWEHGRRVETTTLDGPYNRNDFSVVADVRIPIYHRLKIQARYSYTFATIRKRSFTDGSGNTWTRKQYNNVITFRLVYIFNEKILKKKEKTDNKPVNSVD